jgi:hypothetical protein
MMYLHKDCKIEKKKIKIKILIKNLNPNTYSYKIKDLYFTSYKKKIQEN